MSCTNHTWEYIGNRRCCFECGYEEPLYKVRCQRGEEVWFAYSGAALGREQAQAEADATMKGYPEIKCTLRAAKQIKSPYRKL